MKPWLWIPAQIAHDIAPIALQTLASFREPVTYNWKALNWRGLHFPNRLGLAGGVDKDGESVDAWWTFGPGFIEVGTVTPRPQSANPGTVMMRDSESRALWNKMGFPGKGARAVRENLNDLPRVRHSPLFINIGKNRETTTDDSVGDYAECIKVLADFADAFVINISSPNTAGLRELLMPEHLRKFLGGVLAARNRSSSPNTPMLLKLSPDLEDEHLETVIRESRALGIAGFIASNTTVSRGHGTPFPLDGGVSGGPLAPLAEQTLRKIVSYLGSSKGELLLISAGGVLTPEDVKRRLELGADLVQIYTALIYEGPRFFERTSAFFKTL
jgi:dihydroorotate dehydrogenase